MEASEHPGQEPDQEQAQPGAEGAEGQESVESHEGQESVEGEGAEGVDRNPAHDQSPVASDAQDAVIGDPGLRDEQQPVQSEGNASNVDTPNRTSAPPASGQSGTPLPEDQAAEGEGVE